MSKERFSELFLDDNNFIGAIFLLYSKGGEGPEGIVCDSFTIGAENIPDISGKLRTLADKWNDIYVEVKND